MGYKLVINLGILYKNFYFSCCTYYCILLIIYFIAGTVTCPMTKLRL